ncbi:flavodoxin family protein [Thermodesulfatator atlanticus]|uniref:flavodoxin family protein n=1 Tax=Thermodesulfatator atlanticus TaxID=501497 RepID=UPI0003B7AFD4|nr:flavodoxin family protein [Thermodesulfatator atlanticus]
MSVSVLGILGSPHQFGGTGQLLRCALKGALLEGAKTDLTCLYDGEITPCKGCIQEEEPNCKFPCIFDDFGKEVLIKIHQADVIIFGTPIYWYAPSGVMKNLIDRMTCLENMVAYGEPSYMEGKVVGAITVGADAGLTMAGGYLLTVLNAMGAIVPPWAHAYSRNADKAIYDDRAVMDAINVGLLACGLAARLKGLSGTLTYQDNKNLLEKIRTKILAEKEVYEREHGETNL